jgi:hypothetical protein
MSTDPADNALIEKYLLGKLTKTEIAEFHARLDNDREFARKFRLIKMFPEMMSEPSRLEMEKKLHEAAERVMAEKASRSPRKKILIWVGSAFVAAIVILIILFIVVKLSHRPAQPEQANVKTPPEKVKMPVVTPPKKDSTVKAPQPVKTEIKEIQKTPPAEETAQIMTGSVTPTGGVACSRKDLIIFRWTQKCDTFTRLCIYSETNGKLMLWRGITPGTQQYKIPGNYLYPGKFYWYVRSKEEKHSFAVVE